MYNRCRVTAVTGKPVRDLFLPKDSFGSALVANGTYNVYDFIQSELPLTDIEVLLSRYKAGDVSALNVRQGVYGDYSNLPDNPRDIQSMLDAGKEYFDNLDPAIKSLFSDFGDFCNRAATTNISVVDVKEVNTSES